MYIYLPYIYVYEDQARLEKILLWKRFDFFPSTNSVLAALELCLENNYFQFDSKIYKQKRGVVTGIKLAPTYACIGVRKYEKVLFSSDQALLEKILLWKRFTDGAVQGE